MDDSIDDRLRRARLLFASGRIALARELAVEMLADDPDRAEAHELLADLAAAEGKFDAALEHVQRAIALDASSCNAFQTLAFVHLRRDEPGKAREAIEEALRLHPEGPEHCATAAEIESTQGRWKRVLEHTERGLEHEPGHAGCRNLRAIALRQLGRKEEARATATASLADAPEDASTHWTKGLLDLLDGDRTVALEHFREALRQDPGDENARGGYVRALRAKNPLYRGMLRLLFWLLRFPTRTRTVLAMVAGALWATGRWTLKSLEQKSAFAWLIWCGFAAVLVSLVSIPLYDLVLLRDPLARHALGERRVRFAKAVALVLGSLAGVQLLSAVATSVAFAKGGSLAFVLLVPILALVYAPKGTLLRLAQVLAIAYAAFVAWWIVTAASIEHAQAMAPLPLRLRLATEIDAHLALRLVAIPVVAMGSGVLLVFSVLRSRRESRRNEALAS